MSSENLIQEHERSFDAIVFQINEIEPNVMSTEDLILIYGNSLPSASFKSWVQAQMPKIGEMTLGEYKGKAREEARRLGLVKPKIAKDTKAPDDARLPIHSASLATAGSSKPKQDYERERCTCPNVKH
jgi:hypothetical protein